MARIKIDPDSDLVNEQYAIIYHPKFNMSHSRRRPRDRFPENCINVVASEKEALAGLDRKANYYPAKVVGPCRSSEGFMIFYLVNWLCEE